MSCWMPPSPSGRSRTYVSTALEIASIAWPAAWKRQFRTISSLSRKRSSSERVERCHSPSSEMRAGGGTRPLGEQVEPSAAAGP